MSIRNGRADRLDRFERRYELEPAPVEFIIRSHGDDRDDRHDRHEDDDDSVFRFTVRVDRANDPEQLDEPA